MSFNAVDPGPTEVLSSTQRSHSIWSTYLAKVRSRGDIAESCFQVEDLINVTPRIPHGWLNYAKKDQVQRFLDGSSELYLSGRGYWKDTKASCHVESKALERRILLGIQGPCRFEVLEGSRFQDWSGTCANESNYLTIFTLAWAYIFSAMWVETSTNQDVKEQPVPRMEYLLQEEVNTSVGPPIEIDIKQTQGEALEWWRAILSPGQNWKSAITFDGIEYQSPWSVIVSKIPRITFQGTCESSHCLTRDRAPDFKKALGFLMDFCEMHQLHDQCLAALSITILIPTIRGRVNQLPLPKPNISQRSPRNINHISWNGQAARVPYYMALGCNTVGIVALLSSVFFDESVACNLASAWLDPVFTIVDLLLRENSYRTLLNVLSLREPRLAPLWLGAMIIGLEPSILKPARLGTPMVDLVAGGWVGVDMSFITTEPNQMALNSIRRADECRLLFFLNCSGYERVPICPWQPFGSIPLEQVAMESRVHALCRHRFKYHGWSWDSSIGSDYLNATCLKSHSRKMLSSVLQLFRPVWMVIHAVISWTRRKLKLYATKDLRIGMPTSIASKTATRSIFSWLRSDGWPANEKHIWGHEWLSDDTDEESDVEESKSKDFNSDSQEYILKWCFDVQHSE